MERVAIIFGVMWAWSEVRALLSAGRADLKERDLLNRLAARTPGEYKLMEQAVMPPMMQREPEKDELPPSALPPEPDFSQLDAIANAGRARFL